LNFSREKNERGPRKDAGKGGRSSPIANKGDSTTGTTKSGEKKLYDKKAKPAWGVFRRGMGDFVEKRTWKKVGKPPRKKSAGPGERHVPPPTKRTNGTESKNIKLPRERNKKGAGSPKSCLQKSWVRGPKKRISAAGERSLALRGGGKEVR